MKKAIQGQEGTTIVYDNGNVGILFRYLPVHVDGTIISDLNEMPTEERKAWIDRANKACDDDFEDL